MHHMAQSWGKYNKRGGLLDKQQLRKWAKKIRSELDIEALSKLLTDKLKQTQEYQQSKNVMIFYPLKDEVNLLRLTEDETKRFYLPKINGDNLLCCEFNKNSKLCKSCFNTMETVSGEKTDFTPDLVIVPALAVDKKNYRLGYGKGFYDRFLGANKDIHNPPKTIVCISKELIVDSISPNEYDIPIDLIITD